MEFDIRAGKRVLYKDNNSGWMVGIINNGKANVNEQGIWVPVIPRCFFGMDVEDIPSIPNIEINNIFLDAVPVDDWIKGYKNYFMTKEEYIAFIESDNFEKVLENAYVSDGEYMYYPVSRYTKNWIEKQPFEYIVRSDT